MCPGWRRRKNKREFQGFGRYVHRVDAAKLWDTGNKDYRGTVKNGGDMLSYDVVEWGNRCKSGKAHAKPTGTEVLLKLNFAAYVTATCTSARVISISAAASAST
jgi:hypothetical protein